MPSHYKYTLSPSLFLCFHHSFCQFSTSFSSLVFQLDSLTSVGWLVGRNKLYMAIQQAQFYSDNFGFPLGASQDCGFDNPCVTPQQQQQQQHNLNNPQFQHPFIHKRRRRHEEEEEEFQHLINSQSERLILAVEEERKQQVALFMKKYESRSRCLLIQKDEEIAKASHRTTELLNLLKNMEMESQTWQRAAKENESMVAALIQQEESNNGAAAAAESCCPQLQDQKMMCKCCHSRNSCVVIVPCRHLCCCLDCDLFLDSCPLCTMPKKASIHALIS